MITEIQFELRNGDSLVLHHDDEVIDQRTKEVIPFERVISFVLSGYPICWETVVQQAMPEPTEAWMAKPETEGYRGWVTMMPNNVIGILEISDELAPAEKE